MGAYRVDELFAGRSGGGEISSVQIVRRYTRLFRVFMTSRADESFIACNAPKIPRPWFPYPFDPTAHCKRVWATQESGSDVQWIVQADYDNEFNPANSNNEPNPLDRAPKRSWHANHLREPFVQDKDGNPITNSAGDRFGPDVEIDADHMVYRFTRNEASFDEDLAAAFINSINSSSWRGKPKWTWKCNDIAADETTETYTDDSGVDQTITYFVVYYEFEYNKKTWLVKLLDQGFNKLVGAVKSKLLDEHDEPFSDPQNLDGSGDVLTPGNPAVSLDKHGFDEMPFDLLTIT